MIWTLNGSPFTVLRITEIERKVSSIYVRLDREQSVHSNIHSSRWNRNISAGLFYVSDHTQSNKNHSWLYLSYNMQLPTSKRQTRCAWRNGNWSFRTDLQHLLNAIDSQLRVRHFSLEIRPTPAKLGCVLRSNFIEVLNWDASQIAEQVIWMYMHRTHHADG